MAEIYIITNTINGKRYIGKTKHNKDRRFAGHVLRAKAGDTTRLAKAIRKYGADAMIVETLEITQVENLNDREIYYIDALMPEYNMTKGGDGGSSTAKETNELISAKAKKRYETRAGTFTGHKHTDEAKMKLALHRLGKAITPDVKAKLSVAVSKALSKPYLVVKPDGSSIEVVGLKAFCIEQHLPYTSLFASIKKGVPTNGWQVFRR